VLPFDETTWSEGTWAALMVFASAAPAVASVGLQLDPGTQAIDPSRALLGESVGAECGDKKVEALNETFDAVRAAMTAGDRELTA
jgi:hypothetical protein